MRLYSPYGLLPTHRVAPLALRTNHSPTVQQSMTIPHVRSTPPFSVGFSAVHTFGRKRPGNSPRVTAGACEYRVHQGEISGHVNTIEERAPTERHRRRSTANSSRPKWLRHAGRRAYHSRQSHWSTRSTRTCCAARRSGRWQIAAGYAGAPCRRTGVALCHGAP